MIPIAVLAVLAQAAQAKEALSLDDALAIAMRNAFSLRIAESKIEKARQQERQAKAVFGPTVTVQGNYTRFEGSVSGTGSTGGNGGFSGAPGGRATGDQSTPNDSKSASIS